MIRLCLDNEEYLSSENDRAIFSNPLDSGSIHGIYYGSSTRISGGEIWHPRTGYVSRKISIEVKFPEEKEWKTIFEKYVNFQEELVKHEEIEGKEKQTERSIEKRNKTIQGIRDGTICNISAGSRITISNESYEVILFFRDLHRFEDEVQISGCGYKLLQLT